MGQRTLNALEKYFGRVESVWKPVASEEAFEIVRRRLFEHPGERAEVEGIARQFSDFYRAHSSKLPNETQSNVYFERLCAAYPIHPEVFDRHPRQDAVLRQHRGRSGQGEAGLRADRR